MFPGEKLTDYTTEELNVLLNAVGSYIVDFRIERISSGSNGPSKTLEILQQWSVKIIEAKAEVRKSEITTCN